MECNSLLSVWLMPCRFRWVECQLKTLNDCVNLSDIRKTLVELPRTLDETYDRILCNIPEKHCRIAHRAMQLLAISSEPLTPCQVAEAVAVDVENQKFDPVLDRLREPSYIIKICSTLVIARSTSYYMQLTWLIDSTGREELRFAHYSVKEYLVSQRISL